MPLPSPLRIVADENIPFVREAFGASGAVELHPGRAITAETVRETDVLLVRSVTSVDEALVGESRIRFVGSATIGTDHVDRALLERRGIRFVHAPGSNADSVVEWVIAALFRLAARSGETLREKTVGIVGCGSIGGRLAKRLPAFGLHVLCNDPPLAEIAEREGRAHDYVSLERILDEANVVTLHVPLTRFGAHPTYHLLDGKRLARLRPGTWLLNSCRGAVVSNVALLDRLREGEPGAVALDVWEGEPEPSIDLLARVDLATPHVAGYSFDGKVLGTVMLYQALVEAFGLPPTWQAESILEPTPEDHPRLDPVGPVVSEVPWLDALVRQMYDIEADDRDMRALLELPSSERADYFTLLRKRYPRRRTFSRHRIRLSDVPESMVVPITRGLQIELDG